MATPEDIAGVSTVDLDGTQALVTGSTSGIGRETALALARLGADVIVHGRNREAGERLERELSALGAAATFVRADFANVDSVRDLAATVRETTDGLDLLFNNAGGLFREERRTDLGVEYTFHVNHLSPYLLTAAVLDHLNENARVVVTASAAHRGARLDIARATDPDSYSASWAYGHSKLSNVLFAAELARRLSAADRAVTANSVHPGGIPGSGFVRFLPGPLPRVVKALDGLPGVTSVADGAAELLYAGVAPATAGVTGEYLANQQRATPTRHALSRSNARRLWRESAAILDVEAPLTDRPGARGAGPDRDPARVN